MKTLAISKYVFTVIGFCMMMGAIFFYKDTQEFLTQALVAEGKVVELVRLRSTSSDSTKYVYAPVVVFVTAGGTAIEFTSSTGSNPPGYSKGEVVEVLYKPSSPRQAKINSFFALWGVPTIVGIIGVVFFIVGFSIVLFGIFKGKRIEYLKKNGMPIKAKIQSVGINSSLVVNGRSPYQIYAQWKNSTSSELHVFRSENIWFDPTDHLNGDEITVLIDKENPNIYHVDTSFLPKVAG